MEASVEDEVEDVDRKAETGEGGADDERPSRTVLFCQGVRGDGRNEAGTLARNET